MLSGVVTREPRRPTYEPSGPGSAPLPTGADLVSSIDAMCGRCMY